MAKVYNDQKTIKRIKVSLVSKFLQPLKFNNDRVKFQSLIECMRFQENKQIDDYRQKLPLKSILWPRVMFRERFSIAKALSSYCKPENLRA